MLNKQVLLRALCLCAANQLSLYSIMALVFLFFDPALFVDLVHCVIVSAVLSYYYIGFSFFIVWSGYYY